MRCIALSQLNESMTSADTAMQEADAIFLEQLCRIAKAIQNAAESRPIVLISGPSGSGKTSTAYLLERFLHHWSCPSHTISMDHFFRTMTPEQHALSAAGKMDLESPDRVDIPHLNATLEKVIAGQPVWIPRYDFPSTTRTDQDHLLTRKPGELLILEGIHALNPKVITIPEHKTTRIYVSVRTRISEGGTILHPSRLRLIRRMLRDKNFRHRTLPETIAMFEKVQAGEHRYIAPYKNLAQYSVDTFLPYEIGIYKSLLSREITACFQHPMLKELSEIWGSITPLPLHLVPKDSLVREFAGDSLFHY